MGGWSSCGSPEGGGGGSRFVYSLDRVHPHYGLCGWRFCIVGGRRSMAQGFGWWRRRKRVRVMGYQLRGGDEQRPISPRRDRCVRFRCGGQDRRS